MSKFERLVNSLAALNAITQASFNERRSFYLPPAKADYPNCNGAAILGKFSATIDTRYVKDSSFDQLLSFKLDIHVYSKRALHK